MSFKRSHWGGDSCFLNNQKPKRNWYAKFVVMGKWQVSSGIILKNHKKIYRLFFFLANLVEISKKGYFPLILPEHVILNFLHFSSNILKCLLHLWLFFSKSFILTQIFLLLLLLLKSRSYNLYNEIFWAISSAMNTGPEKLISFIGL